MNLKETIEFYKNSDLDVINDFEKSIQTQIKNVDISQVVEIPYQGNYNLDMVFSLNRKQAIVLFLFKAIEALEYEASEEIGYYNFEEYSFDNMLNELSFPDTKETLFQNKFTEQNCVAIIKLKEKAELTFLIETTNNYIFISEDYWKS